MEFRETPLGDEVVAVQKDHIFAPGILGADVPGFGTRSGARSGEDPEPGISGGFFPDDLFCPVFLGFNIENTFPVLKRLIQDGLKTFSDIRFDVAAGDDQRKERVHITEK